jgi:phosphatidylinositol-3-phosphatase
MAHHSTLTRRIPVLAAAAFTLAACSGSATGPGSSFTPFPGSTGRPGTTPSAGAIPHVMVIVLENQEYSDVVGNKAMPYFNQLTQQYGLATAYHARTHPSLPNYVDLIAGSTMNIDSDCTDCNFEANVLVDQMAKEKIHWTAYMGGLPNPCYAGVDYPAGTQTGYVKRHDPFMYVNHLRTDTSACNNVVPESRLATDLQAGHASPFLWDSPNLCDDGHNTSASCGPPAVDRWLSNTVPMVLQSSWYQQGGTVIVTFDEGSSKSDASCCGGGAHGGQVATLVISKQTKPGQRLDTPVDHAGTLRTIEALYGLPYLRTAADPQSGDLMPLIGRRPTM